MEVAWKPAWQGVITGGDAWEAIVSPGEGHWTWDTECFHRFDSGRASTEAEAKAAALTWIADALREVPTRAARALAEIGEKAPTSPASASESATLPETPPAATERPVGLVWCKQGCVETAEGPWWSMTARHPYRGEVRYSWWVFRHLAEKGSRILGDGDAPTLDAAKAAAEACLRAWVARLNASLGAP